MADREAVGTYLSISSSFRGSFRGSLNIQSCATQRNTLGNQLCSLAVSSLIATESFVDRRSQSRLLAGGRGVGCLLAVGSVTVPDRSSGRQG